MKKSYILIFFCFILFKSKSFAQDYISFHTIQNVGLSAIDQTFTFHHDFSVIKDNSPYKTLLFGYLSKKSVKKLNEILTEIYLENKNITSELYQIKVFFYNEKIKQDTFIYLPYSDVDKSFFIKMGIKGKRCLKLNNEIVDIFKFFDDIFNSILEDATQN